MTNNLDKIIQEIIEETYADFAHWQWQEKVQSFIREALPKHLNELDWILICETAHKYRAYKFALAVVHRALMRNLSFGEYTDALADNAKLFEEHLNEKDRSYLSLFCGADIRGLIVIPHKKEKTWHYIIDTKNKTLCKMAHAALSYRTIRYPKETLLHFAKSFGEKEEAIQSANDLECEMIFDQVEYYRELFKNDPVFIKKSIRFLCQFYRWIVATYPDRDFFCGSLKITRHVLFWHNFAVRLEEGYFFTHFHPSNIPLEHSKIVFVTEGLDKMSTRYLESDHVSIDLSTIPLEKYREMLLAYMVSTNALITSRHSLSYLGKCLELLYKAKCQKGYSNPNPAHLTIQEALLIRTSLDKSELSTESKSNYIHHIKYFLHWCEKANFVFIDPLFDDYLGSYAGLSRGNAKVIPDEDLEKLDEYLSQKKQESQNSLYNKIVYAIFHIALQTEMRISQICTLRISSLQPTVKEGHYLLKGVNKTSAGESIEFPITEITYRVIQDVIVATDTLRKDCPVDIQDYLFIYYSEQYRRVFVFSQSVYTQAMICACAELNIDKYTPANLRDTHMTKAVEYNLRTGGSNLGISMLTRHKNIDTTMNHYVQLKLEEMLEATYEVELKHDLTSTEDKVVTKLPTDLCDQENDVENGCGKCTSPTCVGAAALSCLTCKHFITTPMHEPYFIQEIKRLDQLIGKTDSRHEKEDLTTMKSLYALYLAAIYSFKEDNHEN